MTDQSGDSTMVVPTPTPVPAEQELSAEEIVGFDPRATVEASLDVSDGADALGAAASAAPVVAPPVPLEPAEPKLVTATCPACGTVGTVDYARRDATGFCAACDFPLFWSKDRIVSPSSDGPAPGALRRLPGTAGREALASLLCPQCDEPNPATGVLCVRCGAVLRPVAPEPEPVLVFEPEPEPEPEPVPERAWWPFVLAGTLAVVALAVLLIFLAN
jgi:hypothetical protein